MFNELDTDKDGFLSADEISAGLTKVMASFRTQLGKPSNFEPDWDNVIKAISQNDNGLVGFDEFVTATSDRYRLISGENHMKQAFEILDKGKNGGISMQDLKESFGFSDIKPENSLKKKSSADEKTWSDIEVLFK